jgi:hypothetical protein
VTEPATDQSSNQLLEAIYCSAPIPRSAYVRTLLGVVFDKVHFPGVYLPRGGYDPHELEKEIRRLQELGAADLEAQYLVQMLETLTMLPELETFCVFEQDAQFAAVRPYDPGASVIEITMLYTALVEKDGSR